MIMRTRNKPVPVGRRCRAAHQRELARLTAQLGDDEFEVLVLLAHRALVGQARYGRLAVARDPREFAAEALEEILDGMSYVGAGLLRQRRGRGRDGRRRQPAP